MLLNKCFLVFIGLTMMVCAQAETSKLELASPFSEHMILQRQMPVPVWGWGEPGTAVDVSVAGKSRSGKVGKDGRWKLSLPELPAGGPYVFQAKSGNAVIEFNDVLVGEVWICSGQSNMQLGYNKLKDFEALLKSAKRQPIRSLEVERNVRFAPQERFSGAWVVEPCKSAVGFMFAYELQQALGIPVGIIETSWGSSCIEGWLPLTMTRQLPQFKKEMAAFEQYDHAEVERLIQQNVEGKQWERDDGIYLRTRPNILYNAMLYPLAPYAARGFVWYQGEANTHTLAALLLAGVSISRAQVPAMAKGAALNIVLFIADDLGAADINPYGNPVVRTPNLRALAKDSLLFTRAFASSPTCSPSRASMYSGSLPFRNGAHANHSGIKEGVRTLPVYLQSLGYKVGIAGKFHVGPMSAFPFELIHNSDVPEPGHENQGVLWTDLNMDPVDEWISQAAENKDPFMLVVADHSPHVFWPEKPDYDFSKLDVPSIHIDTEETRKARAQYYTDISKMDGNVGRLLKSLETHKLTENTVVIFTSDQGPQWAFGKWNLYDYGIRVPLLIRWPGKLKGGAETDALVSLVDLLPTAIELAGGVAPKEPEEMDGRSLLPLLRGETSSVRDVVFASHTGDGTMNQSPMRMIRTTRYKYILNLAPEIPYTTHIDKSDVNGYGHEYWESWEKRSYETEQAASVLWRYHNRPKEELYDVKKDPDEIRNLAGNPYYKELLMDFRLKMEDWRRQQGDHETGPFQLPKQANQKPVAPYIFK